MMMMMMVMRGVVRVVEVAASGAAPAPTAQDIGVHRRWTNLRRRRQGCWPYRQHTLMANTLQNQDSFREITIATIIKKINPNFPDNIYVFKMNLGIQLSILGKNIKFIFILFI